MERTLDHWLLGLGAGGVLACGLVRGGEGGVAGLETGTGVSAAGSGEEGVSLAGTPISLRREFQWVDLVGSGMLRIANRWVVRQKINQTAQYSGTTRKRKVVENLRKMLELRPEQDNPKDPSLAVTSSQLNKPANSLQNAHLPNNLRCY